MTKGTLMKLANLFETSKLILTEQKKRIEHPEDMIFDNGLKGAVSAMHILQSTADHPQSISLKMDGSPALIFGWRGNDFVLTDKYGFGSKKYDGMTTSPEAIEQMIMNRKVPLSSPEDAANRRQYANKIASLYPILRAATPHSFQGYAQGDLMWVGTPRIRNGSFEFQPDKILYKVPVDSKLGHKIRNSKVGIVIHSVFSSQDDEEPSALHAAKKQGFQEVEGLVILPHEVHMPAKLSLDQTLSHHLRTLIKSEGANINDFFNTSGLIVNGIKSLPTLMKSFLAFKASEGSSDMDTVADDFKRWIESGANGRISSRMMTRIVMWINEHHDGYRAIWQIVKLITELKLKLKLSIDQNVHSTVDASLRQKQGHEGFVSVTPSGTIKLVNRSEFMKKDPQHNRFDETQELEETLKKVKGRWALVSRKNPKKVLQYYHGHGHPSKEWVSKVERRVHSFSENETKLLELFDPTSLPSNIKILQTEIGAVRNRWVVRINNNWYNVSVEEKCINPAQFPKPLGIYVVVFALSKHGINKFGITRTGKSFDIFAALATILYNFQKNHPDTVRGYYFDADEPSRQKFQPKTFAILLLSAAYKNDQELVTKYFSSRKNHAFLIADPEVCEYMHSVIEQGNLNEMAEADKTENDEKVVWCFMRANPPTLGHRLVVNKVAELAGDGDYWIFLSHSQDNKKNPLDWQTKMDFLKRIMPKKASHFFDQEEIKTPIKAADWLYDHGYRDMTMVVGSDRVDSMRELLDSWNSEEVRVKYNRDPVKIRVVSAGDRDPDAKGVKGISGTKARKAVEDNDMMAFEKSTGLHGELVKELFAAVKANSGLHGLAKAVKALKEHANPWEHPHGTIVMLKMTEDCAHRFSEWCGTQNIPCIPKEDMHVTVLYSKTPVPHLASMHGNQVRVVAKPKDWKVLGERALTMVLECPIAEQFHQSLRKQGGSHGFPEYIVHTTANYEWTDPYTPHNLPPFPLVYDRIEVLPIDPDFKPGSK